MRTILVPLDGSALAEQVLPYVQLLAPILGARALLLRVIPYAEIDRLIISDIPAYHEAGGPQANAHARAQLVRDMLWQHAEDYLAAQAVGLRERGLDVEVEVRTGPPSDRILEVARHRHVSLIAMATRGSGGLRRWTGIAGRIVRRAPTPVFLMRSIFPAPARERSCTLTRILVPLDGSPLARQALPLALELARGAHAEIILLHASSPIAEMAPDLARARDQTATELSMLADELSHHHQVRVTPVIVAGYAADAIAEEVARRNITLIVMAARGRSQMRRWALRGVTDKVLQMTRTPLVLLHAQPEGSGHPAG